MNPQTTFARSLRRVLYCSVILDDACEWLKQEQETPSSIAAQAINMQKAIGKVYNFCQKAAPESWKIIAGELTGDQLQDTILLLDELADVKNIGELTEQIRIWKGEKALKPYQTINQVA